MRSARVLWLSVLGTAFLAACGGGSNSPTGAVSTSTSPGTLSVTPPLRIASLTAADFGAELGANASGAQLLALAGQPACGVDFYYLKYQTVGAAGETASATGALMVPTGGAGCSGPRPIVLYAHGTATDKSYNIANISDNTNPAYSESALVAAMYAAQGFIVVAPNYAGYDTSSLSYHPYLDAQQQSTDMVNALTAARTALPTTFASGTKDSGQLLVTGYSQGGYVAMATMRALEAAHQTVTAAAGGSGPYALVAFGDAVFGGNVNLGSTVFSPLLTTSYQAAYKDIYSAPTDIYSSTYANNIATLLPSTQSLTTLFTTGMLPETALFDSTTPTTSDLQAAGVPAPYIPTLVAAMAVPANPLFAAGFGSPYLINNSYRIQYVADAALNPDGAIAGSPAAGLPAAPPSLNNLRKAFYANDMRNGGWIPSAPLFMCGGAQDPTVFFTNTQIMAKYWGAMGLPAGLITAYSVDPYPAQTGDALQTAFLQQEAAVAASGGTTAVVQAYHEMVAPFCAFAARNFFAKVLGV